MKKATVTFALISCLAACFSVISKADAAILNAASCSQSDVQAQLNAATAGDTIVIPAGTCTWTSGVTWNKGVTIQGAGPTSTIISATTAVEFFIIPWTVDGGNYRLTGLGLTGSVPGPSDIAVSGRFATLRLDHLNISTSSSRALWFGLQTLQETYLGYPQTHKALLDHIVFTPGDGGHIFAEIYGTNSAWMEDDDFGSDNYVFIEDSTFNYANANYEIVDSEFGARITFRYNTVTNSQGVCSHDTGSTPRSRGTRLIEAYNNTFTCTLSGGCYTAANFNRGGSGLFYNNVLTGSYNYVNWPEIYRVMYSDSWVGGGYCSQTGTRKICEDGLQHCSGGTKDGYPCLTSTDCSGGGTCPSDFSCTSNTNCMKPDGNAGVCMQVDGSNQYGYPCRDQMGRGKDDPATGVQVSLPAYWWSNTLNGNPVNLYVQGVYQNYIQEGRDFCNHSPETACGSKAAWNYAPYTYPHPLQARDTTPAAPRDLRVQ